MANASTTGFGLRAVMTVGNTPATSGQSEYKIQTAPGVATNKGDPMSFNDGGATAGEAGMVQDASFTLTDDGGAGGTGNTPPVSPPQGNNGGAAGGSSVRSAGGGGATAVGFSGAGYSPGSGNGGCGATSHITGSPVVRAGGGGGGMNGTTQDGGPGGSGVEILRLPTACKPASFAVAPCTNTVGTTGSCTVATFTVSGTLTL